jgi:hypothetical protein
MADAPRKSKLPMLIGLLAVLLIGGVASGYFMPSLPWAPLVRKIFQKGAEGMDKSGVYKVTVKNVTLSAEEFDEGETLDIQVKIHRVNAEGKTTQVWASKEFGDRLATVGKDSLTAKWDDRTFEMEWRTGDKLKVEVWDLKGISNTLLCVWDIDGGETFPLTGSHTFDKVKGKAPRPGDTNQVVFEASRARDLPAPKE